MEFYKDKATVIANSVSVKTDSVVRNLNDHFSDLSDDVRLLVAVVLTSVAFIFFSTFWTIVTLIAMVAFRAYPVVMDRFFPATFADSVDDLVVEVPPEGVDDDGITIGDDKTAAK